MVTNSTSAKLSHSDDIVYVSIVSIDMQLLALRRGYIGLVFRGLGVAGKGVLQFITGVGVENA